MNRLGLKISCFIASILIWFQVAWKTDVEQWARLPVRVSGLGEGLTVLGNEIPDHVTVRLKGSKLKLLGNRFFNQDVGEVRLNLADVAAGDSLQYRLATGDVVSELEVIKLRNAVRVPLHVDETVARRLPVAVMLAGELAQGAGFLVAPHAVPDSALARGPARFLPGGGALTTEPVNLDRMQPGQSGSLEVVLRTPHEFVRLEPAKVAVHYVIAALEERTLANVPVIPLVDSGGLDVGVSPPVADVMVRGVVDSVRNLSESSLAVTVPVGDRPEGVYLLPGQVDYPPWLTLLGLVPAEFRVIVGNPPLGTPALRDTAGARRRAGAGDG